MRKKVQKSRAASATAAATFVGASACTCFMYSAQSQRRPPPAAKASMASASTPAAASAEVRLIVVAPAVLAGASRAWSPSATLAVAVTCGAIVGVASRPKRTQRRATSPDKVLDKTEAKTEAKKAGAGDEEAKGETPAKPAVRIADDFDAWQAFGRFLSASWDTFLESSTSKKMPKKTGYEYRKGIEGMSMGSMAYEMMQTDEAAPEFQELNEEYKRGYGPTGFVNLTFRKLNSNVRDVSKALGLDFVYLTVINLLETLGVDGHSIDGIPVQNKWITIVQENTKAMSAQKSSKGDAQFKSMVNNILSGKMEKVAGSPMPVFLQQYGEDSGLYKIAIGPRSVVVVSDPVVLKHILLSSQERYTKGILGEILEPIMGKGLIPADPITWKARRRAIVPGFHKKWLQGCTENIVACADILCSDLERAISSGTDGKMTLNMEEKFTSVSLDIIGKAVFDYDFGSVRRESPVVAAAYSVLREAERRAQSVFPYWNLPGAETIFNDQKTHGENLRLLNTVLDELIRNELEVMDKDDNDPDRHVSLLEFLVSTKNEDVTTRQLRDDLMTLLIAGHETTAALLTWSLHELFKPSQKEYLDKVLQEIDEFVGTDKFTFQAFEKMQFTKWVLLETLRLYPQPPLLIRRCEDGDEVPTGPTCKGVGPTVEFLPGQDIFISTWSLQRAKELWGEDANEFNPMRWKEKIEAKGGWGGYNPNKGGSYISEFATDYAFLPFGAGARKCIGDQFALLESSATLVALLQRFDFKASKRASEEGVGMTTGATIHTVGGLFMEVSRRTGESATRTKLPTLPVMPVYERKSSLNVAQRIEPEAMTVPTAKELRMLFTQQAETISSMKDPTNLSAIEIAYEKCREVTSEYSKTFFLGSQLLAPDEQKVVWAIYNWCRETDELVDGPAAVNTTMADLDVAEERLNRIFELKDVLEDDDNWEDLALADGVRKFSLIQRPFQDMIGGMAMDLVKERYQTFRELEVYCYRVAGTVGLMTMPVLGFDGLQNFTEERQERTIQAAMNLGLAFQLTNVLRDIGEDARRGRIYMPVEDLHRFGITEDEIIAAASTPGPLHTEQRWRDFMEFQMERCNKFYDDAKEGIVGLSEINRLGVMAALLVYGELLDEIRKNDYDNFSRRAYVDFNRKVVLMGEAWWNCQKLKEAAQENIRSGKVFKREAAEAPKA